MSGPLADLRQGDMRAVLAAMEPDSVDAVVTDPPNTIQRQRIKRGDVVLRLVNRSSDTRIFANIINRYHSYMNHVDTTNRRLCWLVYLNRDGAFDLAGAIGICSAALRVGVRDEKIGWDDTERLNALCMMANNYRFCLFSPNCGSAVLAALRYESPIAWHQRYGDELVALETFVKPPWEGSVYKADNWEFWGMTKGWSFSRAPVGLWKQEDSVRGELARTDPDEAIRRYASHKSGQHWAVQKSEPKLYYFHSLVSDWRAKLMPVAEQRIAATQAALWLRRSSK